MSPIVLGAGVHPGFHNWLYHWIQLMASYDFIAASYEFLARVYSGGKIPESKLAELPHLHQGDRVLYLGAGAGEDALEAARKGCSTTCIDISSEMLSVLDRRLSREHLSAELICGDSREHDRIAHYDVVVANYFLNGFVRDEMTEQFRHAVELLRPGGLLMIADVAPAEGGLLNRWVNLCYLKSSMLLFWALSLVPWHEEYDYRENLAAMNLDLLEVHDFRLLGWGPVVYRTLVSRKASPDPSPSASAKAE